MFIDFNNLFRIQIRFIEKKKEIKEKTAWKGGRKFVRKEVEGGVSGAFFISFSIFLTIENCRT